MLRRLSTRLLAVLLVASVMVLPGGTVALAASGGTGPADALIPASDWMPLAAGQQVWYAFNADGSDSQILVRMCVSPSSSAAFSVWTPENVRLWAQGNKPNPVGRGAKNDFVAGDLVWLGTFKTAGTYYVLVEKIGQTPGNYKLSISGKGVSFPAPAVAQPDVKTPAARALPAAAVTKGGTGPDDALTVSEEWTALAVGQKVWYALPVSGGDKQIVIHLSVAPANAAGFKILTPEQVRLWSIGAKYEPVGRGAPSKDFGDDPVWKGSLKIAGTYYIVVEQTGSSAGGYDLSVHY
jgi:hypothetical protein